MRHLVAAALATSTLLSLPCTIAAQHPSRNTPTIPQVAKTAGSFTTLLAAVDAAGLTETLLGRGPFTLFAPTDEAFKRLPGGTVEELLKPQNRDKLRTILTYHVVAGRVTAAQARDARTAATVAGPSVRIAQEGDFLRINDATVRIADVPASNGIIHVIDRVLIPTETRSNGGSNNSNGGSAADLIDLAIDRGAPLYNDGQAASTVAIYEVAATALLAATS
jgi:transforming growth factor-beta-induced protein